jgi:hypothetical protein
MGENSPNLVTLKPSISILFGRVLEALFHGAKYYN